MYVWFLADPERLNRERKEIEQLEQAAEWLVGTHWSLNGGLCLDAVIRAHGHDYQVRMTYPTLFPSVPPTVRPLNAEERWTGHQYGGIDGPLCLEWGPDNWHPEVTGAQMLESTYNLLSAENPLGTEHTEARVSVPSRHQLTIGQELRGAILRWYLGRELTERIGSLATPASGLFKFSVGSRKKTWVALIHELQPAGEADSWRESSIPPYMRGPDGDDALLREGVFFKTDLDPESLAEPDNVQELEDALRAAGIQPDVFAEEASDDRARMGLSKRPAGVLILDRENAPHFFAVLDDGGTLKFTLVRPGPNSRALRSPSEYRELAAKSVGIVGVGSAGSKIALTLARMRLGRIFLIDHDIFFPENIERHILDWNHVGDHKVDGVGELVSRVSAGLEVKLSRTHLTGQESAAIVSGDLNAIGECDLIIDATADARVFNLLTAVATATKKPLIWLAVFPGGTGGMIARSQPGTDPDPQTMRTIYTHFCLENPAPELQITNDYTAENAEGEVFIASDADVAVIAHHAARFAVDTVLGRDPSDYPYSMYLIGLKQWWVFDAPFHTIPIATDTFRRNEIEPVKSEVASDHIDFIIGLVRKETDETASSA